jgi:hypothetical protein
MIGKSLAIEWVELARANTVSPGFIESGLTGAVPEDVKDSLRKKTPLKLVISSPSYFKSSAYLTSADESTLGA